MSQYKPTIGLEIHAELKTATKMFCNSKNDPDEIRPNINVCPICFGHPGTLPVINKKAVEHVLRVGVAVGGTTADFTEFDRKNYFYPDIPKGYQISQYKYPLITGGAINGVAITRIHLEEDTARSSHEHEDSSLVDFNRAGLPLMELVTEPVVHDAKEAADFARELQLILRYLGASAANMEKGEMRVEANVSISKDSVLGTKVEVKNLNSFKSVERAISYEIKRQTELLDRGETVIQETRGWDDATQKTFSQRMKEESHDYRYFPDPDLPKLKISEIQEFNVSRLRETLPELPIERRNKLKSEYGLSKEIAETLVQDISVRDLFDSAIKFCNNDKGLIALAANYITSDILGMLAKDNTLSLERITPENLAKLVLMLQKGLISSRGAKDILAALLKESGDVEEIAKQHNLLQQSDEKALLEIVDQIIQEQASVVSTFKEGKESSLQFLVGQAMKRSGGAANPQMLQKIFKERILS
jgi:aspartyl-tRNA(Asn)/glutamyl-tRNA(Gln) amidotransferase subunit B